MGGGDALERTVLEERQNSKVINMKPTKEELKIFDELVKAKSIGKDDKEAYAVIAWALRGRKVAEKMNPEVVKNLVDCGFVSKDNKLYCNLSGKNAGIEFALLINGAKGYIRRVRTPR